MVFARELRACESLRGSNRCRNGAFGMNEYRSDKIFESEEADTANTFYIRRPIQPLIPFHLDVMAYTPSQLYRRAPILLFQVERFSGLKTVFLCPDF